MIDGDLVKRRREELGLSIRAVAEQMSYAGHFAYYRIERGQSQGSVKQLKLLADVLNLTWEELLGENPNDGSVIE